MYIDFFIHCYDYLKFFKNYIQYMQQIILVTTKKINE